MSRREVSAIGLALFFSMLGCGAELGATAASASADKPAVLTTMSTQLQNSRQNDALLGARMNVKHSSDRPFGVRSLLIDAGYRWVPHPKYRLGTELALEIGGGQPSTINYSSIGVYTGARSTILFRAFGSDDLEPRYSVLSKGLGLTFTFRGGTWASPEDSARQATVGEVAATLGIRFDIGSDLGPAYPGTVAP